MIYLDYAANCPVDNEVLDLFYDVTKKYYANPNSSHKLGLEAKKIIDECTNNIAKNLKVLPEEIIYTSGASESNNLAIKGVCERYKNRGKHILISSLEHNSIIASAAVMQEQGFEVELIPIDKDGFINIDILKQMIREDTILVSIVSVDSELGIKQQIEEIGKILKDYPNCIFHTDATQGIGKVDIDFKDVDLITFAPHKFYGLPGFGVLIKKKDISLKPQINGGKSTTIYRSGTPELSNIASLDKALEKALKNQKERFNYIKKLSDKIKNTLSKYENVHINNTENSIPHTINLSIKGIKSLDFQKKLEEYDIYVSTKTSCCPLETPSKLVYALTHDKNLSLSSLRISLSHLTKEEEVNTFLNCFDEIYKEYESNGKI
jgi:cysteine desulfurase